MESNKSTKKRLDWGRDDLDTLIVCVEDEIANTKKEKDSEIKTDFLITLAIVKDKLLLWEKDIIYGKNKRREENKKNKSNKNKNIKKKIG